MGIGFDGQLSIQPPNNSTMDFEPGNQPRVVLGTLGVLFMMLGGLFGAFSWVLDGLYWIIQPVVAAIYGLTWSFMTLAIAPVLIPWRVAIVVWDILVELWEETAASPLPKRLPPSSRRSNITPFSHYSMTMLVNRHPSSSPSSKTYLSIKQTHKLTLL
jgi:hypothetical protein